MSYDEMEGVRINCTVKNSVNHGDDCYLLVKRMGNGDTRVAVKGDLSPIVDTPILLGVLDAVPRGRLTETEERLAASNRALVETGAKLSVANASIDNLRQELGITTRALDRIKARVEASPSGYIKREFARLMRNEPSFVLPTKVGACIKARNAYGGSAEFEFRLFETGRWINNVGNIYDPSRVMSEFKGHRVIEEAL